MWLLIPCQLRHQIRAEPAGPMPDALKSLRVGAALSTLAAFQEKEDRCCLPGGGSARLPEAQRRDALLFHVVSLGHPPSGGWLFSLELRSGRSYNLRCLQGPASRKWAGWGQLGLAECTHHPKWVARVSSSPGLTSGELAQCHSSKLVSVLYQSEGYTAP